MNNICSNLPQREKWEQHEIAHKEAQEHREEDVWIHCTTSVSILADCSAPVIYDMFTRTLVTS